MKASPDMPSTSAPGIREAVLHMLAQEPKGRLLDAGAGPGDLVPQLIELGFSVEACDLDPSAYRPAAPPCQFVDLNETLPYSDGTFDTIVCLETLEHVISPRHTIQEFGRVLRAGGCLVLSTPNIQSMVSRIRFLLVGTLDFFDTMQIKHPTSFWLRHGHISPIYFPVIQQALWCTGFTIEAITTNRAAWKGVSSHHGLRAAVRLAAACATPLVRWTTRRQYPDDPVAEAMCGPALLKGEILIIKARRVDDVERS